MTKKRSWAVLAVVLCLCLVPAALGQEEEEDESNPWPDYKINTEEVDVEWDVTFLKIDGKEIKCDVYLPKHPIAKPTPCIVMHSTVR